MSENKVEAFKPESIADKVKDRIRTSFVDLVPEDAWQAMVQSEIKKFTEDVQADRWDHTKKEPSILKQMIRKELSDRFHRMMIAELDKISPDSYAPPGLAQPGTLATAIAKELLPEMVQTFFATLLQNTVQNIRFKIQEELKRGSF